MTTQPEQTVRKWKTASHKDGELAKALAALGLTATVDMNDNGNVSAMVLEANGKTVRIAGSWGFEVQRLAPEVKTVQVLAGTVAGLAVKETFDTFESAYERQLKLERAKDEDEKLVIRAEQVEVDYAF